MVEKRSTIQLVAEICKKLENGVSEQEIIDFFEVEDDLFPEYIKFSLDNNWITVQNGKYKITDYGREVMSQI